MSRVVSLVHHTSVHNSEEVLLGAEIHAELLSLHCEYFQVYDPDNVEQKLVFKFPSTPTKGRIDLSILKSIADCANLKAYSSKIIIEVVNKSDIEISFVELSFKKQYLQRGNMFRFKNSLIGRTIHLSQNLSLLSMHAQIQELRRDTSLICSGLVTEKTKLVFRSKSARIIWLVQISAEMFDFDQNGNIYFEKFLNEFVAPVMDRWKAMSVWHMLTVIFFSRTLHFDVDSRGHYPDFYERPSLDQCDGYFKQDFFQIVIDNTTECDKVAHIKKLREEFWSFSKKVGWKLGEKTSKSTTNIPNSINNSNTPSKMSSSNQSTDSLKESSYQSREFCSTYQDIASPAKISVPSDAIHGNILEAINTTLNILDKHYMDRDLQRTGNSIVLISAGGGVFKVNPFLSQITKQRMSDNAFGIDLISLSRPPTHNVPLFIVDCKSKGTRDFYEMPHWIRVSYIDCKRETQENSEERSLIDLQKFNKKHDELWSNLIIPHHASASIASQLLFVENFKLYGASYVSVLPYALKMLIQHDIGITDNSSEIQTEIPIWGHVISEGIKPEDKIMNINQSSKSLILLKDVLNIKCASHNRYQNNNKKLIQDLLESIPNLKRDTDNISVSESVGSNNGYLDDESASFSPGSLHGRSFGNTWGNYDSSINNSSIPESQLNKKCSLSSFLWSSVSRSAQISSNLESVIERNRIRKEICSLKEFTKSELINLMDEHDVAANNCFYKRPPKESPDESKSFFKDVNEDKNKVNKSVALPIKNTLKLDEEKKTLPIAKDIKKSNLTTSLNKDRKPLTMKQYEESKKSVSLVVPNKSTQQDQQQQDQNKKLKLSHKNFISKNQTVKTTESDYTKKYQLEMARKKNSNNFIISHGRIIPVIGNDDPIKKRQEEVSQYLSAYARQYSINPFRMKEGESFLNSVTHNRRRWAHLFPLGQQDRQVDLALNFKSLTQPAILPLNTDYVPPVRDLQTRYTITAYTISIDPIDSPFPSIKDAIVEMMCQRLSKEFQLIEGVDIIPYTRLAKTYDQVSSDNFFILTMGHRIQLLFANEYYNTIHVTQLTSLRSTNLSIEEDMEEDERNVFNYKYEMWAPQTKTFYPMAQSFHQFNNPEYRWNQVDSIMAGSIQYDGNDEDKKPRTLKYVFLPYDVTNEKSLEEYYSKFDQFVECINRFIMSKEDDVMSVTKHFDILGYEHDFGFPQFPSYCSLNQISDSAIPASNLPTSSDFKSPNEPNNIIPTPKHHASPSKTTNTSLYSEKYEYNKFVHIYQKLNKDTHVIRCSLKNQNNPNPNWIFLKYDKHIYPYKAFHFEVHWLVCDSWLVDEFISLITRRCTKWGIRLCQNPSYFSSLTLNIHPFRPIPHVRVPSVFPKYKNSLSNAKIDVENEDNGKDQKEKHYYSTIISSNIPDEFPSPVRLVERLFFTRSSDWLFDSERRTDWSNLSFPEPKYEIRDRDLYNESQSSSSTIIKKEDPVDSSTSQQSVLGALTKSFQKMTFGSTSSDDITSLKSSKFTPLFNNLKKKIYYDRQYVHALGLATVRLTHDGFLWMPNLSGGTSGMDKIYKLRTLVNSVSTCYEILLEVIEDSIDLALEREKERCEIEELHTKEI